MEDLTPMARFDSGYEIELADSMNKELGSNSDYVFAYVVHDGVYLCKKDGDEPQWLYDGKFEDIGGPLHESTDKVAQELDDGIRFVDIPGTNNERAVYTEN